MGDFAVQATREEILAQAVRQAEGYEERLANQRDIIERYDRFRKWVLGSVVQELRAWATELEGIDQLAAAHVVLEMADEIQQRGEQPQ